MPVNKFILPKMGESITEATIISWAKSEGDYIQEDEVLVEIATDKVDSELPSPFEGKIIELLAKEGDTIQVGTPIASIETEKDYSNLEHSSENLTKEQNNYKLDRSTQKSNIEKDLRPSRSNRFYSPLIRNIASLEQISPDELDNIPGTGQKGRLTKSDLEDYLNQRNIPVDKNKILYDSKENETLEYPVTITGEVEIIEMDRTRKLIAEHMVRSKKISPHVTSFLEIDVTNIVEWRNGVKESFYRTYNQKLTYTPIFIEAIKNAIVDFPRINASVQGDQIIVKKYINIGMAAATSNDTLIVPVIKNVGDLSLTDITLKVNDLAERARSAKLRPDEIQDGTFTLTNVGSFGNTQGVPIINQPQVAILSTGAIRKKPAVVQIKGIDEIAIRHMMFLSLSYDHRIVDGALGGRFLRRVGDFLEQFDLLRSI